MPSKKKRNKQLLQKILQQNKPISKLHHELFPEEYDDAYDDCADAKLRLRGINPMKKEYQEKVNLRRYGLGVEPYMGNIGVEHVDTSVLVTSLEYCKNEVEHAKKAYNQK